MLPVELETSGWELELGAAVVVVSGSSDGDSVVLVDGSLVDASGRADGLELASPAAVVLAGSDWPEVCGLSDSEGCSLVASPADVVALVACVWAPVLGF